MQPYVLHFQIDKYAQRDLKKGLHLYGTDGNIGLTNAWSIIQTDVSLRCCSFCLLSICTQYILLALNFQHNGISYWFLKVFLGLLQPYKYVALIRHNDPGTQVRTYEPGHVA